MSWSDLHPDYTRVSSAFPCPICGKADGCLVRNTGEHVICYHVPSTKMWKIGFLHRLAPPAAESVRDRASTAISSVMQRVPDFSKLNDVYVASLNPERHRALATQLGVSAKSLDDLDLGWSNTNKVYTFPVCDYDGRIVGIQTRDECGNKRMIKGSTDGLFYPSCYSPEETLVFITEGASDTAAAIMLDLNVLGRFNCLSGADDLIEMVHDKDVYIIPDNSGNELQGAAALRDTLRSVARSVQLTMLPFHIKDLRVALKVLGETKTLSLIHTQVNGEG